MDSEAKLQEIRYLREAIDQLENAAKDDLKIALYGSSFFLVVSLIPVGRLDHASLLVSAIDLWYFMSWGNDQLRLQQYRKNVKDVEGADGVEVKEERHPNFLFERFLYYSTSLVIVALFVTGLVMDWHVIRDPFWRNAYFALVISSFSIVALAFLAGFRRTRL